MKKEKKRETKRKGKGKKNVPGDSDNFLIKNSFSSPTTKENIKCYPPIRLWHLGNIYCDSQLRFLSPLLDHTL